MASAPVTITYRNYNGGSDSAAVTQLLLGSGLSAGGRRASGLKGIVAVTPAGYIVGAIMYVEEAAPANKPHAVVRRKGLAVSPPWRGRGIGKELQKQLKAQYPQHKIILWPADEALRKYYHKSGYATDSECSADMSLKPRNVVQFTQPHALLAYNCIPPTPDCLSLNRDHRCNPSSITFAALPSMSPSYLPVTVREYVRDTDYFDVTSILDEPAGSRNQYLLHVQHYTKLVAVTGDGSIVGILIDNTHVPHVAHLLLAVRKYCQGRGVEEQLREAFIAKFPKRQHGKK